MSVELITGYAGEPHISSADDGARNIGTFGDGKYVLSTGTQLACSVQGANTAVIGAGDVLFEGRHVRITGTNEVALDNGAQGINRNDIVCLYYSRDTSTTVEAVTLVVLKGTGTSGTPVDPTIPSGSIAAGSNEAYMALWRIPITGITPGTPVKLYGDVLPDMHDLATRTLPVAQVPNIPASKITSGTLAIARGGTGASTFSPHAVLIGPSSGSSAAAPTKRALVAADIPSSLTSDTSGNAATASKATKLSTARSLYVALGSTYNSSNPVTFDGSANKALPVSGTLPAARGGTGQTSLQATRNAMGLGNTTGALPVANGGTGSTSAAAAWTALGGGSIGKKNSLAASDIPSLAISKITNLQSTLDGKASKVVQLYYNASGWHPTSGASPSLSLSVSNIASYRYIRVYFTTNEAPSTSSGGARGNGSVEIDTNATKYFTMMSGHIVSGGTRVQIRIALAYVTSSGITAVRYLSSQDGTCLYFNMPANEIGMDDKVWIYRIEGWN